MDGRDHFITFDTQPQWEWGWQKFGLSPDSLFNDLNEKYNTVPCDIQSREAFHRDVSFIVTQAKDLDDFHSMLAVQRDGRLREAQLAWGAVLRTSNLSCAGTEDDKLFLAFDRMAGNLCFGTMLAFVDALTADEHKYPRNLSRIVSDIVGCPKGTQYPPRFEGWPAAAESRETLESPKQPLSQWRPRLFPYAPKKSSGSNPLDKSPAPTPPSDTVADGSSREAEPAAGKAAQHQQPHGEEKQQTGATAAATPSPLSPKGDVNDDKDGNHACHGPLGPPPPQWRLPRARGTKKNNPQQAPASFSAPEGGDNAPPPDTLPPASDDDGDTPGRTTEGTTAAGAAAASPSGGRQEEHKGGSQPQTRSRAGKPVRHQQQQQQGQGAQQADAAATATATATATKSPLSSNRDDNGGGNINRGDHGPSTTPNKESQRQHHQTGNKKRPRTPIPDDDSGPACKARRSPACRPRSGGI